jgi:hypothetical protein
MLAASATATIIPPPPEHQVEPMAYAKPNTTTLNISPDTPITHTTVPAKPVAYPLATDNPAALPYSTDVAPSMPTPSGTSGKPFRPKWNSTKIGRPWLFGTVRPGMPRGSDSPNVAVASTSTLHTPAMPSGTGSAHATSGQNKTTMILDIIYEFPNNESMLAKGNAAVWSFLVSSSASPALRDTCRSNNRPDKMENTTQVSLFSAEHNGPVTSFKDAWPGGDWETKAYGKKCNYMNDGTNSGALWCEGQKLDCFASPGGEIKDRQVMECPSGLRQVMFISCQWHEEMRIPGNLTTKGWVSNKSNGTHFLPL